LCSRAENILYGPGRADDKIAITSVREGGTEIRHVNWAELRQLVAQYASSLAAAGIRKGDRVAMIASNTLNTALVFLATVALGGIFTSTSTDMGTKGILDRLLQVKPKIVFMEDWALYSGKVTDLSAKMREVSAALTTTVEFATFVVCPRAQDGKTKTDVAKISMGTTLPRFLQLGAQEPLPKEKVFVHHPFATPYLIAYSSGTTGQPKCIVHSAGGVLLSQKKELFLLYNIGPHSTQMTFTTTSWAMYNKSITSMLTGGRIINYDGSPFAPKPDVFLRIAAEQGVTHLGASPRYLEEIQRHGISPKRQFDLSKLEMVNCTGAALLPQQYEWFYSEGFPAATHLANSAGGTDTACCFASQVSTLPVYAGELQRPSLAMDLGVFEEQHTDGAPGVSVPKGEAGELVVRKAFPTMPLMFWPQGAESEKRYFDAYFAQYRGVWTQGDYVRLDDGVTDGVRGTGGIEFLGRSDGVLNPSGVRFGSAEIYSVLIAHFPQVEESICVGQRRTTDTDESVYLFLLMRKGQAFTPALESEIRQKIRQSLSARHVPKYIFECPEIPMTINGKKVEVPVKKIICGKTVVPSATLANPQCLKFFERFVRVEELVSGKTKAKL
jgi:acetoacetyl-CoA synthetase